MDDYRRGASAPKVTTRRAHPQQKDIRAFVIGGETRMGSDTIKELCNAGWRVAFTHPDVKSGREIAQQTGSQHHPMTELSVERLTKSIAIIVDRWGAIDLAVDCAESTPDEIHQLFKGNGIPIIKNMSHKISLTD